MTSIGRITLRIIGKDLDPGSVTELLGISPSQSFRRGDPREPAAQARGLSTRRHGAWLLTRDTAVHGEVDDVIRSIAASVPAGFVDNLKETDVTADLFVGLFEIRDQSTFSIEPATARLLADRGLPLIFDLYVAGEVD